MICRDCYHFGTCVDKLGTTKFYDNTVAANNVENLCEFFIDRNAIIKIPCKLGDTVYKIVQYSYPANKACHKRIGGNKLVVQAVAKHRYFKIKKTTFNIEDLGVLGETVFLYPEEAEKRIKELMEI